MDNYEAVLGSIRGMNAQKGFGLSQGHITVSTVGHLTGIRRLAMDAPKAGCGV